jgi:hypothetical protein
MSTGALQHAAPSSLRFELLLLPPLLVLFFVG